MFITSSCIARNGLIVDSDGKAQTRSVTEEEGQFANENGDAYNLNTGTIGLTSSTASGVLYYKHQEDKVCIIESIVIGVGSAGTVTDSTVTTVIRNPTAGTLISGASAVAMNQNRNFGSSNTLANSLAYKGAEGNTVTDGDNIIQVYTAAGTRTWLPINLELQKGNSVAFTMDTKTSSGTTNVYIAMILHLKSL